MGRIYKKKTDRIRNSSQMIRTAVQLVLGGGSIRRIASDMNISKSALQRYVQKTRTNPEESFSRNIANKKVFSEEQEGMLRRYIKMSSNMLYGLCKIDVRKLAYQYAKRLELNYPPKWDEKMIAGREWLEGFLLRSQDLSLRTPEATSRGRASSFNPTNVNAFFDKLAGLMQRKQFSPDNIYNLDETGVTTVQKPPKVIAPKGQKQVGQITSQERGQLVTMCNFISAIGNTLPPAYIFPRAKVPDHLMHGAPPGSLGLAHKSGWMTSENFVLVMRHFIKHSKASTENPVLLLIDNHESHITVDAITEAKENGVHILTFPPHCSHRLQPLDVSVYGPFKARYNAALNNWMISNPGKTVTIYNVAALSAVAFNAAMTKDNILSGFRKTGISPFCREIFTPEDFLMSSVTDQPNPNLVRDKSKEGESSAATRTENIENPPSPQPGPSNGRCSHEVLRPEDIFPFPKAAPTVRKGGRRPGRSRIITDTPEKDEIINQKTPKRKPPKVELKKICKKIKLAESDSSDTDESLPDDVADSSSDDIISDAESEKQHDDFDVSPSLATLNSFVLCKFDTGKNPVHYIGKIESQNETVLVVNFLRRKRTTFEFYYPDIQDKYEITQDDIVMRLPDPKNQDKATARTAGCIKFNIDLNDFYTTLR